MPAYGNVEVKVTVGVNGSYGTVTVSNGCEELYRSPMYDHDSEALDDAWSKWQEIKNSRSE